ncbi:hypothetical protein GCM10028805_16850 [Spirosoma harenae]
MKFRHYLLAGWALMACLTNCKKPIDPVDPIVTPIPKPDPDDAVVDPTGLVCPIGEPIGASDLTEMIGPAGGTVSSEDGKIRIDIPAGALTSEEAISIQPLTNTNPTGKGAAFRLEPHGTTFARPVKITFAYDDIDLQATVAEALQVAYQEKNGVWMAMPGAKLNKQAKTLTIETTHFSDWSYFSTIFLSPQQKGIQPGESVPMTVYTTMAYDELLAPLVKPSPIVQLHQDQTVPVIQWSVAERIGKLATTGASNFNTYTAPTGIVKPTPVTVTAQVQSKRKEFLLLVSSMMIIPEGIVYRLDGGPWIHRVGIAQRAGGQSVTIGAAKPTSNDTGLAISIVIPRLYDVKNMSLSWGLSALFTASPVSDYLRYDILYVVGKNLLISPGYVYISEISYSASNIAGIESAAVSGSFTVPKSGAFNGDGYLGTHRIEGYFSIGKKM